MSSKNLTMANLIAGAFAPNYELKQSKLSLDSAKEEKKDDDIEDDVAFDFIVHAVRMDATSAVRGWLESDDDLDVGEGEGDRLMGVMIAAVHDDEDESRLTPEQSERLDMIREEAGHYLLSLGADEDDIDAALNDWDDEAAENIRHAISCVELDSVGYYLDSVKKWKKLKKLVKLRQPIKQ